MTDFLMPTCPVCREKVKQFHAHVNHKGEVDFGVVCHGFTVSIKGQDLRFGMPLQTAIDRALR